MENQEIQTPDIVFGNYFQLKNNANNYALYELFKAHTGIELEWKIISEDYGADCYGMIRFMGNEPAYPSLKSLETKFEKHKKIGRAHV